MRKKGPVEDVDIKPIRDDSEKKCSETCCDRDARMLVNGYPLCEMCMRDKLGKVRVLLGTTPPFTEPPCR